MKSWANKSFESKKRKNQHLMDKFKMIDLRDYLETVLLLIVNNNVGL